MTKKELENQTTESQKREKIVLQKFDEMKWKEKGGNKEVSWLFIMVETESWEGVVCFI